ncbi:hypothetical protein GCM10011425_22550 [Mucilaginibacter galii]|uniref:Uncharacterized protein n=1 Tax=Mucilaginibacter galii TaxID=2005073 RepID=A0A917J941_9SPHI|nr:hypothetical protein [Mucilaginibacter galii]GGI51043.1 hypothetical protein GCM10011425_22550 [Mucilaginibacter galii]
MDELTMLLPRSGYPELFVVSIAEAYNNQHRAVKEESDELIRLIGDANRKVDNARELLLLHELEAGEYRKIKEENGSTVARLEMRLNEVNVQKSTHVNIKKLAQMAVNALCEVDKLYDIASIEAKRYLVGILFPEKMTYVEGVCRTGKLNRAAELIYLENKELRAKKWGKNLV